ncbi:unnamed protein product [Phytomonas sp. EM1]|nr:unnamed protein product [Phytomonas sp. EM1]|eukprot:CCW61288.1 unnamed protein product [Phytomonas sp. isolate EM1]
MSEDPNIVYVFVEDEDSSVTMEDVSDWLGIIDEIESIRLQFDATSGRTCFQVRFRRSESAQQTVQYLSGAKLKNCTMIVKSRTFQKREDAPAERGDTHDASAAPKRPKEVLRMAPVSSSNISAVLPLNSKLPPGLQMDAVLADLLPTLAKETQSYPGAGELMQELLVAQAKLAELFTNVAEVDQQIQRSNEVLEEALATQKKQPRDAIHPLDKAGDAKGQAASPSKIATFSNSTGIAASQCSPLDFVVFLTERFGPILQCECLMNPQTEVYFVSFQFMMPSDSDAFKQRIHPSAAEGLEKRKKSRVEVSLYEKILSSQEWNVL